MKRFLSIMLVTIETILLVACSSKESTYQPTELENVSTSVLDVSTKGATLIIKDTNEIPYTYGEWYVIEKEKDGTWYEVKEKVEELCFDSIGYIPNEEKEIEFQMNWESIYGKLSSGHYRILKTADSHIISVEFDIK